MSANSLPQTKNEPLAGQPRLETPDELRARLLRPVPVPTLRGILVTVVAFTVFYWALSGTRPSAINRIEGPGDVISATSNLLVRMWPPEFEYAPETVRTFTLGTLADGTPREFTIGYPVVLPAIFETVQMAVIGTLGAVVFSLPLSLLAAQNTSPHPIIYFSIRLVLNFMRSIPELVYALLFVAAVGLGPFTGTLALIFGTIGSLTRLYAEAIEQIDPQQVLALRATGASGIQAFVYSVIPQAMPLLISYSIVYFEGNVRHATILGYVGAGGVGFLLFKYTGTSAYPMLMGTTLAMMIAVTIIDRFSSWLRLRFI